MPSTASVSGPAPADDGSARAAISSSHVENGNQGRDIDAWLVEPRDEGFQAPAALLERTLAQIVVTVGEEIVDAQMRRKLGEQFRRHCLAVQPLLQHVERLHAAVAHDQQLAVDRALELQRLAEIGKAPGDFLAGARIEPRDALAVFAPAGDRLQANAVPLPLRHVVGWIERGEFRLFDRVREHDRAERRRIARDRLCGAAFDPGKQIEIGRREPRPDQFDLVRVLAAEGGDGGLRQPRRDADAQRAGDQLEQRPAAGRVERIEPARELRRQLGFAERGEREDDGGERGGARAALALQGDDRLPSPLERGGLGRGVICSSPPPPSRLAPRSDLPLQGGR